MEDRAQKTGHGRPDIEGRGYAKRRCASEIEDSEAVGGGGCAPFPRLAGGNEGFVRLAKAYFQGVEGVKLVDNTTVKVDGAWVKKRDVVRGVVMK